MEIKINKEVRNHKETIFFGMSARQLICSVAAIGTAVGIYLGLKDVLGEDTVSWLCILAAAPLALAGFFNYNGLTFEQFAWAFIKSSFLCAGPRLWKSENYLYETVTGKEDTND